MDAQFNTSPFGQVTGLNLSLMTQQTVRAMAVCEVTTASLYDKGIPRAGGINDLRLGSGDRRLRCGTCSNDMMKCTSHTAFFKLAKPVYHASYMSHIIKYLRSVCPTCYRLVVPYNNETIMHAPTDGKDRFDVVTSYVKTRKTCGWETCMKPLPRYTSNGLIIRKFDQKGTAITMFPSDVRDLFRMLDPLTVQTLGIPNPEDFVLEVLLIPPPSIRPTISYSESIRTRGHDDLTGKLNEIIKISQKISEQELGVQSRKRKRGDDKCPMDLFNQLQLNVASYIDNDVRGARTQTKKRSGQPDKCIVMRWKGKRGRLRGNIQGKRVDFSARTVISPDPGMDVDEIGVPEIIAKKLTYKERVNPINIKALQRMVDRGPEVLSGAVSITNSSGTRVQVSSTNRHTLQVGWTVERYMKDGDRIIFNRQPSLRKLSLMSHKVKVMSGKTFRLNLSCTGAYNGDFDGDEVPPPLFFNFYFC